MPRVKHTRTKSQQRTFRKNVMASPEQKKAYRRKQSQAGFLKKIIGG